MKASNLRRRTVFRLYDAGDDDCSITLVPGRSRKDEFIHDGCAHLWSILSPLAHLRYLFESNKEQFLPTLTFSGGRVDVSILWPEVVEQLPAITDVCFPFLLFILDGNRQRERYNSIDSRFSMDSRSYGHLWSANRFFWESFQIRRSPRTIANAIRQIIPLFRRDSARSFAHRWQRCERWTGHLLRELTKGPSLSKRKGLFFLASETNTNMFADEGLLHLVCQDEK